MTKKESGWSSPQIIIATLTLFAAIGTSYLRLQSDNSAQLQNQISEQSRQINEQSRRLAIIETRLEYLSREHGEAADDRRH